jgi:hypothetical protein
VKVEWRKGNRKGNIARYLYLTEQGEDRLPATLQQHLAGLAIS